MSASEIINLLVLAGLASVCVTATVEMFAKMEERSRANPAPKPAPLRWWLSFSGVFGQDLKAIFWSVVACGVMTWAGWLDVRGEGIARYVATAGLAVVSYAVAAKIGYDLFWKAIRAKVEGLGK